MPARSGRGSALDADAPAWGRRDRQGTAAGDSAGGNKTCGILEGRDDPLPAEPRREFPYEQIVETEEDEGEEDDQIGRASCRERV